MTLNEFIFAKIFYKSLINDIKLVSPNVAMMYKGWMQSSEYKVASILYSKIYNKLKKDIITLNLNRKNQAVTIHKIYLHLISTPKKCHYCSITETHINKLYSKNDFINKRTRGKSLEIERKDSNLSYSVVDNLVYACYWCNNAKTDTFTSDEFIEVGKKIKGIWEKRLNCKL